MKTLRFKRVKTRKEHQCFACLRLFPPGTEMMMQTCASNDIYTIYNCDTCDQLLTYYSDSFMDNEGLYPEGCVQEELSQSSAETPEALLGLWNKP